MPGQELPGSQVILGTVWGQTLAQDGSGFYNDLMAEILSGSVASGDATAYRLMPYRRATASFRANRQTCLFPSAKAVLEAAGGAKGAYIETDPIFSAQEHLFARSGEQPPRSLDDLAGKTIAVPNGSIMLNLLKNAGARLITVHDETDKAQMLITGRVDMMSGMLPNEHLVAKALDAKMPSYDRDFPLVDAGVAIVCHDTPAGHALIKRLNSSIAALQATDAFRQKMAAAGVFETEVLTAASLNDLSPASGHKLRFVHPGRRLPFSNIR